MSAPKCEGDERDAVSYLLALYERVGFETTATHEEVLRRVSLAPNMSRFDFFLQESGACNLESCATPIEHVVCAQNLEEEKIGSAGERKVEGFGVTSEGHWPFTKARPEGPTARPRRPQKATFRIAPISQNRTLS